MKKNTEGDIFEVYSFFRSPNDALLRDCLMKPYEDVNTDAIKSTAGKAMCKEKVPTDLTFEIHDTDQRYKRLRLSLFYKTYTEKNVTACEPLLITNFPSDKKEDVDATHILNFLLCQTIAE